jgi:hypothetical protein
MDYSTIPSIVYTNIWVQNINMRDSKIGYFTLDGVRYDRKFQNAFKEYWEFPNSLQVSPNGVSGLQLGIYTLNNLTGDTSGVNYSGERLSLDNMSFPQYYIVAEAPSTINVKSDEDLTFKVANAKFIRSAGFVLPEPDDLNLYFYTLKLPNHKNGFKTPVTTIPPPGGPYFTYVYPGKNIKADYEAHYFDTGEGAAVVKSVKSYPVNYKNTRFSLDVKCLVTFVNIAQKTYQFVP